MLKKMFISMVFMTMLVIGVSLYLFQEKVIGTFDQSNSRSGVLEQSFENEDYFYFLSDKEINRAIGKGTTSIILIEDYLLESPEESLGTESHVAFAYIETPYLTTINIARNVFDHYGRIPSSQEVKQELFDQYLPIHIRFNENKGYVYDLKMIQDEKEIEPFSTEVHGSGAMKTIYLNVGDLDFSMPATVIVEDSVDSSVNHQYEIDFENYIP
ncbi:hypothetical protein ACM26V_11670 [Salipaludibacillus sp. HK11]|uniref:hypothetical protein n=1 Tax=Salipaludibacillus sp. HK11 TaxID=3394320 RepID=UPI0039FDCFF1